MRHITRLLLGSTAVQFFSPPDGGGGGGGGADTQGGGGGGAWQAPAGLPAEFAGKDAAETLGKVLPAFTEARTRADGLRGELARVPKAPDKPELYTFKPSEKLAPFFGDLASNPALTHARAAFHKAGVPDSAFQSVIEGTYGPMIEAGMIQAPYDAKAEVQTYMKHNGVDAATATAHFKEGEAFANGLAPQLKGVPADMQKDVTATLVALTDTAAGNVLLRAIQARLGETGFRLPSEGSGTSQGAVTAEEARRLSADPRIDPANRDNSDPNKRFDPVLRQRYDDYYKSAPAPKPAF